MTGYLLQLSGGRSLKLKKATTLRRTMSSRCGHCLPSTHVLSSHIPCVFTYVCVCIILCPQLILTSFRSLISAHLHTSHTHLTCLTHTHLTCLTYTHTPTHMLHTPIHHHSLPPPTTCTHTITHSLLPPPHTITPSLFPLTLSHTHMLQNAPHTMKVVTSSAWNFPYPREKAAFPAVSLVFCRVQRILISQ